MTNIKDYYQGRIFLRGGSQGETSVMRVRLEGHKRVVKNPFTNTHAHHEHVLGGSFVYSTSANVYLLPLMRIHNGLMCICNGFFMTLYDPQV